MGTRRFKISSPLLQIQLPEVRQLGLDCYPFTTKAIDLNISKPEAEEIMEQAQNPSTQQKYGVPLTQSAAMIANSMRKFSTRWPPLDKLLKGGITHGHILEISGPPGCPKESIAIDIAVSVLQAGERVIFVGTLEHEHLWLTECKQLFVLFFCFLDCQNMTSVCGIRNRIICGDL